MGGSSGLPTLCLLAGYEVQSLAEVNYYTFPYTIEQLQQKIDLYC